MVAERIVSGNLFQSFGASLAKLKPICLVDLVTC